MGDILMDTAYRIGPQEDKLIRFLSTYVRATFEQCRRHPASPKSPRILRRILTGLVTAKYVAANKGFSQDGKPPVVYSPTLQGWRYAEKTYGLPIPGALATE